MQITGTIEHISKLTTLSNGKQTGYFIVNEGNGTYPNIYKIDHYDKVDMFKGVKVGQKVAVEVNSKVNEYQGKHYMTLNMWKLDVTGHPSPQSTHPNYAKDDWPF